MRIETSYFTIDTERDKYPLNFFKSVHVSKLFPNLVPRLESYIRRALEEYKGRYSMAAPPPDFPSFLFPYQKQDLAFILRIKRAALFWDQGMGKTVVGIEFLKRTSKPALVVVPTVTIMDNWKEHGLPANTDIVTYASLHKVADRDYATVIFDESHAIKSTKAKRTKLAWSISRRAKYVLLLSGTPVTRSPMDIYAQMKTLWPIMFLNKQRFIEEFVRMDRTGTFPVGYKNLDALYRRVLAVSVVRRKDQHLVLPDKRLEIIYVDLPDHVWDVAEELQASLQWKDVICQNHLVVYQKLHQLSAGVLYSENGEYYEFPLTKTDRLVELVLNHEGRLVVWYTFRAEGKVLEKRLRDLGISVAVAETGKSSQLAVRKFLSGEVKVLLASVYSLSEGVNLQRATNLAIYHSLPWGYKEFAQSMDRIHRIGARNDVKLIFLLNRNFIDEDIWAALERKRDYTPHERLFRKEEVVRDAEI